VTGWLTVTRPHRELEEQFVKLITVAELRAGFVTER